MGLQALLNSTLNTPTPSDTPDEFTELESEDLLKQEEIDQKRVETSSKKHDLVQKKAEHDQRIGYAKKIYNIICIWLLAIFLIIVASGIEAVPFTLSEKVLITLLTTTTVTVLGLFITVLKYLFGRNK
jgi:hypothetical protein